MFEIEYTLKKDTKIFVSKIHHEQITKMGEINHRQQQQQQQELKQEVRI